MIFSDLYINGKWVEGAGRHPVYDPSDGSVITEIAIAGEKVDAAMNAAAAAFPTLHKRLHVNVVKCCAVPLKS